MIKSLKEIIGSDTAEVGGKAWHLAQLLRAGFPVPTGWVIPTEVWEAHLAAWGVSPGDSDSELRAKMQQGALSPDLLKALAALPNTPFAVRSSAAVEDGATASYSGIFESVLGVRGLQPLAEAVRQVWASACAPEALEYHRRVGRTAGCPAMAVLLMPLVDARAAGVAFSAHPVDGNPFVIAISAGLGLGTGVVQGRKPVDRYLLDWDTLAVLERKPCSDTSAALDEEALAELGALVRGVDGFFETRIDLEFAVTARGPVVLQARPIVGLPPYFPEDPRTQDPQFFCCHQERMEPLSPYARATFKDILVPPFPPPPWPMEVDRVRFRHGRAFAAIPQDPDRPGDPEAAWEDRGFLRDMLSQTDPEAAFRDWYQYADLVYGQLIPSIRARAEGARFVYNRISCGPSPARNSRRWWQSCSKPI